MSSRMFRRAIPAVLLAVSALASTALAAKLLQGLPLLWKPSEVKGGAVVDLSGITNVKIKVEPQVDVRPDKAKFGESREEPPPRPVTTSGNVAAFCTEHLTETLRQFGYSITAEQADYVLEGEVTEFMVIETDNYYQTISDSLQQAAQNLAADPGFRKALGAK